MEETSPPPLPSAVFGAPDNVSSAADTATGDVGQPPQDTEVPLLAAVPRRGPAIPAGLDFSPLPDGDTAPSPAVAAAMPAEPAATMPAEIPEQQPAATTALTLAPGTEKAASAPSPAVAHALGGTNQTAPEWDAARRAYIFWNGNEWLQYDYARQTWGPISR